MPTDYYNNASEDSLDGDEKQLYDLIMEYRAGLGLESIPLSAGLNATAGRHALDSVYNTGYVGHSWSDKPYDGGDSSTYPNMWEAPQRLDTSYEGYGYEISTGFLGDPTRFDMTPERALGNWQKSPPHNAVITNQSFWDEPWGAIGIGLHEGIAHVWFGHEPDPLGGPVLELGIADTGNATDSGVTPLPVAVVDWSKDAASLELVASTYQYFNKAVPGAEGFQFLISSATNSADLNDPYYETFNQENRYINFASNLGTQGSEAESTKAMLTSMSFSDVVRTAYDQIIGTATAEAVGISTEAAFEFFDGSIGFYSSVAEERVVRPGVDQDLATKLVLIGSMLNEASKSQVGNYANVVDTFVNDVTTTGSSVAFGTNLFDMA